jgi:uncharacterized protein (DUF1778 family)
MPGGRPHKDSDYVQRIRVNFRFRPEVAKAVAKAAKRKKLSQTDYVEAAVRAALEADGLLERKNITTS